jgi:hypothetical protein
MSNGKEHAMTNDPTVQRAIDNEHIRLLSIFYYVLGAMAALWAFIPLIYVVIGMLFGVGFAANANDKDAAPLAFMGILFVVMGLCAFVLCAAFAALKIYTGYCLAHRKNRVFCYIVAALSCLSMPFGTILGIFTFIVLARPTVAAQFQRTTAEVAPQ